MVLVTIDTCFSTHIYGSSVIYFLREKPKLGLFKWKVQITFLCLSFIFEYFPSENFSQENISNDIWVHFTSFSLGEGGFFPSLFKGGRVIQRRPYQRGCLNKVLCNCTWKWSRRCSMFIVSVKTTLDHKRVTSKFNKSTTNCGGQISLNKCIHSKIFAFLFINFPYYQSWQDCWSASNLSKRYPCEVSYVGYGKKETDHWENCNFFYR